MPSSVSSFEGIDVVALSISQCKQCTLCESRKNTVPGEGSPTAELMFIGEAPGDAEDAQGRPFIGEAGQLLGKMIEAMGVKREAVYITQLVKCRPPENRNPRPEEIRQCSTYLKAQIELIKPKVIVALGGAAAQALLQVQTPITVLRGKTHLMNGVSVVATFHPAYLLKTPSAKKDCWDDLKIAMKELGWKKA